MADLIEIGIQVNTRSLVDAKNQLKSFQSGVTGAIKGTKALERNVKLVSDAFKSGNLSQRQYYKALSELANASNRGEAELRKYANQLRAAERASAAAAAQARLEAQARTAAAAAARVAAATDAAAAATKARLTQSYNQLLASINPTIAAQQRTKQTVDMLRAAVAAGAITTTQAAQALNQYRNALRNMGAANQQVALGMNRTGVMTQQAGYQIGDFIVQVQGGTNAFVAFGQQATQMAGMLTLLGGRYILLGSALGITIPLLTALGAGLMRAKVEADAVYNKFGFLEGSVRGLASAFSEAGGVILNVLMTILRHLDIFVSILGVAAIAAIVKFVAATSAMGTIVTATGLLFSGMAGAQLVAASATATLTAAMSRLMVVISAHPIIAAMTAALAVAVFVLYRARDASGAFRSNIEGLSEALKELRDNAKEAGLEAARIQLGADTDAQAIALQRVIELNAQIKAEEDRKDKIASTQGQTMAQNRIDALVEEREEIEKLIAADQARVDSLNASIEVDRKAQFEGTRAALDAELAMAKEVASFGKDSAQVAKLALDQRIAAFDRNIDQQVAVNKLTDDEAILLKEVNAEIAKTESATEKLLEYQRRINDLQQERKARVQAILDAVDGELKSLGDQIALNKEILKFGKDSSQVAALKASQDRESYMLQQQSAGILGNNLTTVMDTYDELVSTEATLKESAEAAQQLANALNSAAVFSGNLDKSVDALRARLAEAKGEQGAVLANTIEQMRAEAKLNADRIRASKGDVVANAQLAIDQSQIDEYARLTTEIESNSKAAKGANKEQKDLADSFEKQLDLQRQLIGQSEAYIAVRKALGDSYGKVDPKRIRSLEIQYEQTQKIIEQEEAVQGVISGIADSWAKFVSEGFKDFKGFAQSVFNVFKNLLVQMIATAAKNRILISLGMGGSVGGTAASAATNAVVDTVVNTAVGAITGTAAAGTAAAGTAAGTAGTAAGSAAAAGTAAGTAAAGYANFAAGVGSTMGTAAGTAAAGTAAGSTTMFAIGAAAPYILAAVLIIGLLSKKVTTSLKEIDSGVSGMVKGFDVAIKNFSVIEKTVTTSRFFGLSKKTRVTSETVVQDAPDSPLIAAVAEVQQAVVTAAEAFGFGADAFKDFSYEFKLSLMGLSDDQKVQKINEELTRMGDAFADMLPHFSSMNELLEAAEHRYQIENRLLTLQGKEAEVVARNRERELAATHELNREMLQLVFTLEDAEQQYQIENRLLEALGRSTEVVIRNRERELAATHELNREMLELVFSLEDAAQVAQQRFELEGRLLEMQGDIVELRKRELDTVHVLNKGLAARLQLLQAEADLQGSLGAFASAISQQQSLIRRAVDALVKPLQDAIERTKTQAEKSYAIFRAAADKTRGEAQNIVDIITGALSSRNIQSEAVELLRYRQSQQQLASFAGGASFDESSLRKATEGVSIDSTKFFGSFEDYARDFYKTQISLTKLADKAQGELTDVEKQIDIADKAYQVALGTFNETVDFNTALDQLLTDLAVYTETAARNQPFIDQIKAEGDRQVELLEQILIETTKQVNGLLGIENSVADLVGTNVSVGEALAILGLEGKDLAGAVIALQPVVDAVGSHIATLDLTLSGAIDRLGLSVDELGGLDLSGPLGDTILGLGDKFSALDLTTAGLNVGLVGLDGTIGILQSSVNSQAEAVLQLDSTIINQSVVVDALSGQVTALSSNVVNLDGTVFGLGTNVVGLGTNISDLGMNTNSLGININDLGATLSNAMSGLGSIVSGLSGAVSGLVASNNALASAQKSAAKAQVNAAVAQISSPLAGNIQSKLDAEASLASTQKALGTAGKASVFSTGTVRLVKKLLEKRAEDLSSIIAQEEAILAPAREQIKALGVTPTFATGGMHSGGMRLVGEQGPELEVTGPSRIYSAQQTKSMISGDSSETVAELRGLRQELSEFKAEQRKIGVENVKYNKKTYDLNREWDVVGLPEIRTS